MQSTPRHKPRPGLVRLARNCWIDAADADDLAARCRSVLESSPPDSVISSVTAGRLHGIWLPDLPDTMHVATASPGRQGRSMTRTRRPELTAHRLQLTPQDVTVVDGVPVMTLARTWRHLAGALSLPDLVAAGDYVLRAGVSAAELAAVIDRTDHAPFSKVARQALPMLDGRSRSRPESHLRVAVSGPGMPRFEVNVPVYREEGGWLAEPDLSLEEAKLALEYQGADHAEVRRMRRDLTRGVDLRSDRWLSLPYGPAEVFGRPWVIRAEVRETVLERAPWLMPGRGHLRRAAS
jgi:hypothetical protein